MRLALRVALPLCLLLCLLPAGCGDAAPEPPATLDPPAAAAPPGVVFVLPATLVSPLGKPLDPLPATAEQEERIRQADARLAADPPSVDLMIEAALAREAVWRYRESTELYTRALEIAPDDYRLYLNRAHRTLRLRLFDWALADLERAKALDPYGFNTAYLLGFTHYVRGEFSRAADEYGRCMALAEDQAALALAAAGEVPGDPRSCMQIASDNASRVAITAWRYRALRRAARLDEGTRLLESVPPDLDLSGAASGYAGSTIKPDLENIHYYETLLFYRGQRSEKQILDRGRWAEQWSTVAYGVAVWRLIQGDQAGAVALMEEIVAEPYWARLGHVAAEADLVRLGTAGAR
jgi:tetratricopeptide (TPR) repeat protein